MPYIVINGFKDTKDNNTVYKPGDPYPKTNHKPSKKRIEKLLKVHPKYKRVFIKEVEEEAKEITEEEGKAKKPSSKK
jgi:hypothetical protein